jgi:tetratricopeptide (TPR) repeat protein
MLFDLRSRGRRGTVRVIYLGLALLFGIGLVGFGVGGGFGSGGLFTAATENEGSNGASFARDIKKYRKLTQVEPGNITGWEQLTKALLHESGQEAYVTSTGVTAKGKELFHEAAEAWERYLSLNPAKANTELAQLMVSVYGEAGLNQPAKAVQALQIVVASRPKSAALYASLAQYAYKAHLIGVGDLASAKAVALAPAADRTRIKNELAEVKASPNGGKTYTTTTNGKVYLVKKAPNGSYTGTLAPTQPPASTTTTKK